MNICIVGAGYVGLTTAAVLAELGATVSCVDRDEGKIESLNGGIVPIYEPGLDEMIQRNRKRGTLYFRADVSEAMEESEAIMIAVGTPSAPDGTADLIFVKSVLQTIATVLHTHKTIIMKSTVPPGTGDWAETFLLQQGCPPDLFDVVSNPEFLREGTALYDTLHPDRMVIGTKSAAAAERVKSLYEGIETDIVVTGRAEAELIKYGSNAFLATKISFVNELARVCDAYGADITKVAFGIGLDSRIGGKFLQAGIGYGGSCLPKDVNALIAAAAAKDRPFTLLGTVAAVNESQLDAYVLKLEEHIGALDSGKRIAVWGATFKENTDDIRYSQALALMEKLAAAGCQVSAYDPLVSPPVAGVEWAATMVEALEQADALVVATGWKQFVEANWNEVKGALGGAVVMDGRNVLDKAAVERAGLHYIGVGRP
ncbi:UDP-glucose dehydrogenase family protein [Paenibacillus sp. GCM10027627]|uniref:UDP-glucose dehydrogenase family protein n=1 Tax=unclassified Paenibacillus TaxID=185978 RepID=UPI003628F321